MGEAKGRRKLYFDDADALLREVDSLLASGYSRAGKWSLGQMCDHLAKVIEMSIDGYPMMMPAPVRWLVRWVAFKKIQRHEPLSRKVPAPKWLQPADGVEDRAGVDRLRAVVARWKAHAGPMRPSPIFGAMTNEEWRNVHLWHAEHHLSFLHPVAS